jgi:hypothetical protein
VPVAASGGMAQLAVTQLFPGPAFFPDDQLLTVCSASKQASFFERVGSPRAGRHPARFLKGVHRNRIVAAAVGRGLLLHDWDLTKIW